MTWKQQTDSDVSGWDARQFFAREIVNRINIFGNTKTGDKEIHLTQRWEALRDFYIIGAAWYPDTERKRLWDRVYYELTKDMHSGTRNQKEQNQRLKRADVKIDEIFLQCMINVKNAGLLMPTKERSDPSKAIMDMGE